MNILQVYCSYSKGGGELQTLELARGLSRLGHRVILGAPRGSFLYQRAEETRIPIKKINIRGSLDLVGIYQLFNLILKEKIEILHLNQGKLFWPGVFLKMILGKKIKLIFHRRTITPLKNISRWILRYVDRIIADSRAVERVLLTSAIAKEKVLVIYPGIDLKEFSPVADDEIRKKYNLANCFVVGCIGAMNPPEGKGQKYLIEAIGQLAQRFPNLRLLLIGDGRLKPKLIHRSHELNITNQVIFVDYQKDIKKFIAAMDILCLPSNTTESFGVVMIEAQAMGKPVIGTNVGGIPETLIPEQTGYIVSAGDSSELAQKIAQCILEPERLKIFSANCRKWVENNFDINEIAKKIEREVYQ